jgi:hypothetical protein
MISGLFESGAEFSHEDIKRWNDAYRQAGNAFQKSAAAAGYPSQGTDYSGEFSPLIAQSIQATIDSATLTMDHVVACKRLAAVDVTSPLHEATVIDEHGSMHLDGFAPEGGAGTRSRATRSRKTVQVKYLVERREITRQAMEAGILAGGQAGGPAMVSRSGLAAETASALTTLAVRKERAIFWGDASVNPLQFDGIYRQIEAGAPNNIIDMAGEAVTPQKLIEMLQVLVSPPNYGFPDTIWVDPRYYGVLQNIALSYARFALQGTQGTELTFGNEGLRIMGPRGPIKIEMIPLMLPEQFPAGTSQGDAPPTFVVSNLVGTTSGLVAAADASSKFLTTDAGDYRYKIEAVGDGGVAATYSHTAAVTVAAGDRVKFDFDDASKATSGDNSIRYYRVYRSPKNGAAADATYMWQFARNTAGASSGTLFYDTNAHRPGTAPIFVLQNQQQVMYWLRFMDTVRIPLAQVELSTPFVCVEFGTPWVKVPKKCLVLDNVALSI